MFPAVIGTTASSVLRILAPPPLLGIEILLERKRLELWAQQSSKDIAKTLGDGQQGFHRREQSEHRSTVTGNPDRRSNNY